MIGSRFTQSLRIIFPVQNKWLDSNSNDRTTHVLLTQYTVNEPCAAINDQKRTTTMQNSPVSRSPIDVDDTEDGSKRFPRSSEFKRTYHVETKTGKKGFLGLSPTGIVASS